MSIIDMETAFFNPKREPSSITKMIFILFNKFEFKIVTSTPKKYYFLLKYKFNNLFYQHFPFNKLIKIVS